MKKISIAVPTYEMDGNGSNYLIQLFETIKFQTFENYEVCISDHSKNNDILEICEIFANYFEIKYYKNIKNLGNSPANINSAMEMTEGEIIKIIFQDDFFYSPNSLESIVRSFNDSDKKWLVSGCNHCYQNYYYNEMYPKWNSNVIKGVNTISSPSVLSLSKNIIEKFDTNLTMMMDCEYYYNLFQKYGDPIYLNEIHITNRIHEKQISSKYIEDVNYEKKFNEEINYCLKKYNLV